MSSVTMSSVVMSFYQSLVNAVFSNYFVSAPPSRLVKDEFVHDCIQVEGLCYHCFSEYIYMNTQIIYQKSDNLLQVKIYVQSCFEISGANYIQGLHQCIYNLYYSYSLINHVFLVSLYVLVPALIYDVQSYIISGEVGAPPRSLEPKCKFYFHIFFDVLMTCVCVKNNFQKLFRSVLRGHPL